MKTYKKNYIGKDTEKNYLFYPGSVVKYKGQFYLLWNINESEKAQLINKDGVKFTETPATNQLTWVDQCPIVKFAGCEFIVDRHNRVFCTTTGNLVYKNNCPERQMILTELYNSPLLVSKVNFYKGYLDLLQHNRSVGA
ncbi:MAG: hypothetical protein LC658_06270 [Bacteroidales bacterium]|nr:hypothetical protein [Bacteroidales bacterium]